MNPVNLEAIRQALQWCSLLAMNAYLGFIKTKQVYQGELKATCVPVLNCHSCPSAFFSCPIGTFQHFMTMHKFPYILAGYLAAVGIFVGALACGWLCPFGLLQDLLYRIKSAKVRLPEKLSALRWLILLLFVILFPLLTQETWFSKLCPMGTIQAAMPWVVWNPIIPVYAEPAVSIQNLGLLFVAKVLLAFLFLGFFIVAKRPFCRMICPLGAIFGFFNRYSLLRIEVDTRECKDCQKCRETCPVDINISDNPGSPACVRCFKCLKCENVRLRIGPEKSKGTVTGPGGL